MNFKNDGNGGKVELILDKYVMYEDMNEDIFRIVTQKLKENINMSDKDLDNLKRLQLKWESVITYLDNNHKNFITHFYSQDIIMECNEQIKKLLDLRKIDYARTSSNRFSMDKETELLISNELQRDFLFIENMISPISWDALQMAFFTISYINGTRSSEIKIEQPLQTVFGTKVRIFDTFGKDFDYKNISKNTDLSIWSITKMNKLQQLLETSIVDTIYFSRRVNTASAYSLSRKFLTFAEIYKNLNMLEILCSLNGFQMQIYMGGYYSNFNTAIRQKKYYESLDIDFVEKLFKEAIFRINEKIELFANLFIIYYYGRTEDERKVLYEKAKNILMLVHQSRSPLSDNDANTKRKDGRIRGIRGKGKDLYYYRYAVLQERIIQYSK